VAVLRVFGDGGFGRFFLKERGRPEVFLIYSGRKKKKKVVVSGVEGRRFRAMSDLRMVVYW
jgi:hypothetical protein